MAEVVNMPRLSDTMEEGVVAKWLKQEGDQVEEGEILAEIETDKATMEFESFHDGFLLYQGIKEGDGAPVDSLLAIIGEEGEDIQSLIDGQNEDKQERKDDASSDNENTDKDATDTDDTEMPDDVEVVTMPRLSDTMEEGTVAKWLKQEGDEVEEGEILAEIETDKATMEFESFFSGQLIHIGIQEGESAPVDDVLAIIGPEGTDKQQVLKALRSGGSTSKGEESTKEKSDTQDTESKDETADKSSKEATSDTSDEKGRIFASPLAKRLAREKGYDLSKIKGSGENGRIIKRDIEEYQPQAEAEVPAKDEAPKVAEKEAPKEETPVELYQPAGEESFHENKNSQMRKTIAKRLLESKNNAPHYYLTIEADMSNAMHSRKQINALPDTKISFNDMVIKASAMALRKHPQVNSSWNGDTTRIAEHIHIGVAVAVEEGLLVPTLTFADQQSLKQINNYVKNLANKAQTKKLQPDEM